jgi:hypothetical protein
MGGLSRGYRSAAGRLLLLKRGAKGLMEVAAAAGGWRCVLEAWPKVSDGGVEKPPDRGLPGAGASGAPGTGLSLGGLLASRARLRFTRRGEDTPGEGTRARARGGGRRGRRNKDLDTIFISLVKVDFLVQQMGSTSDCLGHGPHRDRTSDSGTSASVPWFKVSPWPARHGPRRAATAARDGPARAGDPRRGWLACRPGPLTPAAGRQRSCPPHRDDRSPLA